MTPTQSPLPTIIPNREGFPFPMTTPPITPVSSRRLTSRLIPLCAGLLLTAGATAQNTQTFLSTLFGGSGRKEITAICRGPGQLITITGYTNSVDMPATTGSLQATNGGGYDAFVAQIDPTQPPPSQLLWCTYLGGSGRDCAFDLKVDASNGIVSVVGSTDSTDFPSAGGQPPLILNGQSDGFLVQLDPGGSVLLASMLVGGSDTDRLCELELDQGSIVVAGVTKSANLPMTAGTHDPTYNGGTDCFVARVAPLTAQVLWATYLGGSNSEGNSYSSFVNSGGWPNVWEGYLAKMGLAIDAAGNVAIATVSNSGGVAPPTTAGAVQTSPAGSADAYLAVLDPTGSTLQYGTFFGGTGYEAPMAIAAHPAGGFVLGGYTISSDLPVTPGCLQPTFQAAGSGSLGPDMDGWLCHVDPGLGASALRYATYLGGNTGEDSVSEIAVESSGIVTIAGWMSGGGSFPTTPRALLDGPGAMTGYGYVTRLDMAGMAGDDLLYSTRVGAVGAGFSWLNALQLDERGDAWLVGTTDAPTFPTNNAYQSSLAGDYDGCLLHLPLLPGCVGRSDLAAATPACGAPLYTGMAGAPIPGTTFAITATNAPPAALGLLVLGNTLATTPIPLPYNGNLLVNPQVLTTVVSDNLGAARFELTLASSLPAACPWNLAAQWVFFTNATCPGTGTLATSARLDF